MYSKQEVADKMLNVIKECKDVLPKLKELNDIVFDLRNNSIIGDLIPFGLTRKEEDVFKNSIKRINQIIELEDVIKQMQSDHIKEYKIGQIVISNTIIKTNTSNYNLKVIDNDIRTPNYNENSEFIILDINGTNYTLCNRYSSHVYEASILIVTKEQLDTLFRKESEEICTDKSWFKIEFMLNGIHEKFAKDLSEIRIYANKARERSGNYWDYVFSLSGETNRINVESNEVFGFIGKAYFEGDLQDNYLDIVFDFKNNFLTGFSQRKNEKNIYKYNGKISKYFKDGDTTYFPKDVFSKTVKGRIVNIVKAEQIIKKTEQNIAQG